MTKITYLAAALAAMAAWSLPAHAAQHEQPAAGEQKAAKAGFWQIRPNDPFRTEEGPIERDTPAAPPEAKAQSPVTVAAADSAFEFKAEEVGWEPRQRAIERRRRR